MQNEPPFFDNERPKLTLDELMQSLADRNAEDETKGPIIEDLRLYLLARSYQGWTHEQIIQHTHSWSNWSDRYLMNLMQSIEAVGSKEYKHDKVYEENGAIYLEESRHGRARHKTWLKLHESAFILANGGRTGDTVERERENENLDLGFTVEHPPTLMARAPKPGHHGLIRLVLVLTACGLFLLAIYLLATM